MFRLRAPKTGARSAQHDRLPSRIVSDITLYAAAVTRNQNSKIRNSKLKGVLMAVVHEWQGPLREQDRREAACRVDTIVMPFHGSPDATALSVARILAQLEGAILHLVHLGAGLLEPRQKLEELGLLPRHAKSGGPGEPLGGRLRGVVLDQLAGEPEKAITNLVRGLPAPLIVMPIGTGGQHSRIALEELAEAVLASAPARILLVNAKRGEQPWQIQHIVLAHDGTPSSDFAIPLAADLARRAGADVSVLHVAARTASHPAEPGSLPAPRYVDQPQHEWPRWAGDFVERMMALGAAPSAVNFKLLVSGGQPGSEIAQFTHDHGADLVVVAWHGHWQAQRSGAVKAVVRRARCPVLLICAPARP
jgi:nucleotide-binding universal stress UspA family protein